MSKDPLGNTERDIRNYAEVVTNKPVGVADAMPGTNGAFTMAAFTAESVPVGTHLYKFTDVQRTEATPDALKMYNALKPFVAFADALAEDVPDTTALALYVNGCVMFGPSGGANVGALRRARDASASLSVVDVKHEQLQRDYDALKKLCERAETAAAEAQVEIARLRSEKTDSRSGISLAEILAALPKDNTKIYNDYDRGYNKALGHVREKIGDLAGKRGDSVNPPKVAHDHRVNEQGRVVPKESEYYTDDKLEDMILPLICKHFSKKEIDSLTYDSFKDGIGVTRLSSGMRNFARVLLEIPGVQRSKLAAEVTAVCNSYLIKQGDDFQLGADKCARDVLGTILNTLLR